jgi:hypothetical protein
LQERKYAEVQSSSVAQAACDLELYDCGFVGCSGPDNLTMAGPSFAGCSRITFSLRCHIERMVRWNLAGIARDDSIRFHFLLFLLTSDPFVGCEA